MTVPRFAPSSLIALLSAGLGYAAEPSPPNPYVPSRAVGSLVVHYVIEHAAGHGPLADAGGAGRAAPGTETLYVKGDRYAKVMRMGVPDGGGGGGSLERIAIVTPEHVYSLDPRAGAGTRIENPRRHGRAAYDRLTETERRAFQQRLARTGGGSIDLLDVGRKVGAETVLGQLCDVYQVGEPEPSPRPGETPPVDDGPLYMKSWVWRETGIPLRVSVAGTGWIREVRATKVERDVEVGDSRFAVPPGVVVTDDRARSELARRQALADFERLRTGRAQVVRIKVEPERAGRTDRDGLR